MPSNKTAPSPSQPDASLMAPYQAWAYRPDIQGVRAVGAILIAVYHIWIHKVSGGVDVFFVMSGFLMTALLLKAQAREGRIRPLAFWGKIIRRVAPSAYLILLVTLIYGYFLAPGPLVDNLITEVIYSALHLENLRLIQTATDYLARDEPVSAVQQFWALSIQMQFYAVLPLLLFIGLWLSRRHQSLLPLITLLALLCLLSFAYSVYLTAAKPAQAYFNPAARGWEFLAGALLAILSPSLRPGAATRAALGLVGLALLFGTGMLIPSHMAFPGYVALMPVSAAVLLLIAGMGQSSGPATSLLSSPPLVSLGNVSFTIYLWHWPLLVFYQYHANTLAPGLLAGLLIILASVALAYATHHFFEKPLKSLHWREPLSSYALGLVFLAPLMATSLAFKSSIASVQQEREAFWTETEGDTRQARLADLNFEAFHLSVAEEDLRAVKAMLPSVYHDGCHQDITEEEALYCILGDAAAEVSVALVGGSHATQWLPALDRIGQERGLQVINMTKSGCPFGAMPDSDSSCHAWNRNVLTRLQELQPDAVITNSTRSGPDGERVPEEYLDQWRAVTELGIPIIGIRDNPWFDYDVPTCLALNRDDDRACTMPRARALQAENPVDALIPTIPGFHSIDMNDFLCDDETCYTAYGKYLFYRDQDHLSVPYVASLSRALRIRLTRYVPTLFGAP
jgi:peptidoglycan/LPS O-acetylase OafA/YrhL